jgi:hypothetical protein
MINRALLCCILFSFFCVQALPLSAAEKLGIEISELPHPAAKLIEKKLNKLMKLASDKDNPKNIDKAVNILVDLKFDLWNQYQIHANMSHAINEIQSILKEQGIEDVKKYIKPIKDILLKKIKQRYKKEKKSISISKYNELFEYDLDIQDEDDLINHHETGYTTQEGWDY